MNDEINDTFRKYYINKQIPMLKKIINSTLIS